MARFSIGVLLSSTALERMHPKRWQHLRRALLFLILSLIVYYVYDQLQDGWGKLERYRWSLNVYYLLLGALANGLYVVLATWIWRQVLSYLGSELGFRQSFRILQLSQLGKYLPGRIWAIGGQLYLGEREGIPRRTVFWALGLQWFFNLLSGAIIFLPLLYILTSRAIAVAATLMLLCLLGLGLFPLHFLRVIFGWLSPSLKERLPKDMPWFSPNQSLTILLALVLAWLLFGFSFWSLISAFVEIPLATYYEVSASFCGAWVLGTLSFFAPAGIGVREGALVYLLGQFLASSLAVMISIAFRLWLIVVELLCAFIAWLVE